MSNARVILGGSGIDDIPPAKGAPIFRVVAGPQDEDCEIECSEYLDAMGVPSWRPFGNNYNDWGVHREDFIVWLCSVVEELEDKGLKQ